MRLVFSVALAATVVGVLIILIVTAFVTALGYDESYNLQVPLNVAAGHGYATDGYLFDGRPKQFDAFITTGPVLLLPIAGAISIFGEHVWIFRIFPIAAYLGLIAAWCAHGHRVAARQGALFAGAGVVALALTRAAAPGPGEVLGEIASAGLVVASALALRRPRLCGLLCGLAVMTKVIVLAALPALMLGVVIMAIRASTARVSALAKMGAFFLLPILLWQVFRYASLGWDGGTRANRDFIYVFAIGGSGLGPSTSTGPLERLAHQSEFLGSYGLVAAVTAVVVVCACLALQRRRSRRIRGLMDDSTWPLLILAMAGLTLELWWLFLADRDFVRHSTQATFFMVPSLFALVPRALREIDLGSRATVASCVASSLLAAAVASHGYSAVSVTTPQLADQRDLAATIRGTGASAILFDGWWQNPELTLLTGLPAQPLGSDGRGLLVVADYVHAEDRRAMLDHCMAGERHIAGYTVCWVASR